MTFYRDAIHPSKKGTARMAENLFPQKQHSRGSTHNESEDNTVLRAIQTSARHSSRRPSTRFSTGCDYVTPAAITSFTQPDQPPFPRRPSDSQPSSYFHPDHKQYGKHFPSLHPSMDSKPLQNKEYFQRNQIPMKRSPPVHPPVSNTCPSNTGEQQRLDLQPQQMRPPAYPMHLMHYSPFPPPPPPNLWPYYMNFAPPPPYFPSYNQPL